MYVVQVLPVFWERAVHHRRLLPLVSSQKMVCQLSIPILRLLEMKRSHDYISPAFWGFWRMLLPEHILLRDGCRSEASQCAVEYPASEDEFKHISLSVHSFSNLVDDILFIISHLKHFR